MNHAPAGIRLLVALGMAAILSACSNISLSNPFTPKTEVVSGMSLPVADVDLITMSHAIADALVGELRKNQPSFHKSKPILVTTFVNLSHLDKSSELGLVMADQVASRFSQHGYAIVESKLRQELSIKEDQGEFILSREIDKLSREYQAYAVIAGNYTQTREVIYMTAKLIKVGNKQVLASVNAKVPLGSNTRELLIETSDAPMLRAVGGR